MFLFDNTVYIEKIKNHPIFSQFSIFTLKRLLAKCEIIEATPGTILFEKNTLPENVYYIFDGCIELFSSNTLEKKISYVSSGEMLGEISMIADEKYSSTARVHRTSHVLIISRDIFYQFFKDNAEALMQLSKNLAKRIERMQMRLSSENYSYKNILLYCLDPSIELEKFKQNFLACAQNDQVKFYALHDYQEKKIELISFLKHCDTNEGVNVFFVNLGETAWEADIFFHTDYIYFVTKEEAFESIPTDLIEKIYGRSCDLVIVHEKPEPYSNTIKFYEKHPFKRHHHFRDETFYYKKLYRFITGQAIGLVVSSGGFRGYAHYGMIKALLEAGIPIDCIGGCSIGASIGAGLASHFNWKDFDAIYKKSFGNKKNKSILHFTLPLTSFFNGKRPTLLLQETFENIQIEDLPINFFCIVSNLSTRKKEVKSLGTLWEWLRGSLAIPGIFPPLVKNGEVYVDGAVCTALPVQDMREYLDNAGKIISLEVCLPLSSKNRKPYSCPPILTFKNILFDKLGFSKKKYVLPMLSDVLLESFSISQYMYDVAGEKQANIVIAPDISNLNVLTPSAADPQNLIAYEFAKEKLKEHHKSFERWL